MPEEYIPSTIPFSQAVEESRISTQPPSTNLPPAGKKFPLLTTILLLILATIASFGIYLFVQVYGAAL